MHSLITRLSVFGTYDVRMNIDEVQEDENIRYTQTCGVYTVLWPGCILPKRRLRVRWSRSCLIRIFLIYQVMDRLHKKEYMLTEIALILECIDTYMYILIQMTSKVIGPNMFSSIRKHLDTIPTIRASFARPRVYDQISAQRLIKYQHKSLVYRHIYFTDNRMLQY